VVKARNCREPEYPSASQRLGEHGTVVLAMLVGADGKVTESKVEKSSGYPRLDEAARVALSRCRFTPGTSNGVPEPAWAPIKYVWKLPK
jgi:protein TonB